MNYKNCIFILMIIARLQASNDPKSSLKEIAVKKDTLRKKVTFADPIATVITPLPSSETLKKKESEWVEKLRVSITSNDPKKKNKDLALMIIQRLGKKDYQWQLEGRKREFEHYKKQFNEKFSPKEVSVIEQEEIKKENDRVAAFRKAIQNNDEKTAQRLFSIFNSEDQIWINGKNKLVFEQLLLAYHQRFSRKAKEEEPSTSKQQTYFSEYKKAIDSYDKNKAESLRNAIIKRNDNKGPQWTELDERYQTVFKGMIPLWLRKKLSWVAQIRYLWQKRPATAPRKENTI